MIRKFAAIAALILACAPFAGAQNTYIPAAGGIRAVTPMLFVSPATAAVRINASTFINIATRAGGYIGAKYELGYATTIFTADNTGFKADFFTHCASQIVTPPINTNGKPYLSLMIYNASDGVMNPIVGSVTAAGVALYVSPMANSATGTATTKGIMKARADMFVQIFQTRDYGLYRVPVNGMRRVILEVSSRYSDPIGTPGYAWPGSVEIQGQFGD